MIFFSTCLLFLLHLSALAYAFKVKREDGSFVPFSFEKRADEPGQLLRLPLQNHNDKAYSATVGMGTPYQELQFAVSLSQNYIAVAASKAASDIYFKTSQSTSFTQTATDPTVPFAGVGGGSFQGKIAHETCRVQDFHYNASIVLTPAEVTDDVYPNGCSAILGYGVNPDPQVPADGTLLGIYLPKNFTIAECGIQLNRASEGGGGGFFTMGGRDPAAFTGDFQVMQVPAAPPAAKQPSWSIPLDNIKAGFGPTTFTVPGGVASIDPLYPDITVPEALAKLMYDKLSTAQPVVTGGVTRYRIPCDSKPSLLLTFGGRDFALDERDAIVKEADGTCFGAVRARNDSAILQVGANFMRNVYTIFGAENKAGSTILTVGFASKAIQSSLPNGTTTTGTGTGTTKAPTSTSTQSGGISKVDVSLVGMLAGMILIVSQHYLSL